MFKRQRPAATSRILCGEIHDRRLARLAFQQGLGCSLRIQYSSASMIFGAAARPIMVERFLSLPVDIDPSDLLIQFRRS